MRNATAQHPNVNFIAVSHSDQPSAEKWLEAIGGPGELHQALWLLLYAEREIFAKWCCFLGPCSKSRGSTGRLENRKGKGYLE
jgi:hypothetical protein